MVDTDLPEWFDKTAIGAVGVVTLVDGDSLLAELVEYDEESNSDVVMLTVPDAVYCVFVATRGSGQLPIGMEPPFRNWDQILEILTPSFNIPPDSDTALSACLA